MAQRGMLAFEFLDIARDNAARFSRDTLPGTFRCRIAEVKGKPRITYLSEREKRDSMEQARKAESSIVLLARDVLGRKRKKSTARQEIKCVSC